MKTGAKRGTSLELFRDPKERAAFRRKTTTIPYSVAFTATVKHWLKTVAPESYLQIETVRSQPGMDM